MAKEWRNWTGDQRCRPSRIDRPASRGELAELIKRAAARHDTIRVAGSGHSFTDIACTGGTMLRLDRLNRLLDVDRDSGLVKVEAGINLRDMNERIWGHGMALENLGDIDKQCVAGAVSTGTHGTGARFQNMSTQVVSMEIFRADGKLIEISGGDELLAARVSLGALGVIATLTFKTVPAFTVKRVDSPLPLEETLEGFDDLADGSDHFEFFVFPHTDVALLRQSMRTDEKPDPPNPISRYANEVMLENWAMSAVSRLGRRSPSRIPKLSRAIASKVGKSVKVDRSYRVFASDRRVKFTEMEYAIPRRHSVEAIRRIYAVASSPDLAVGFPIEVRVVGGDQSMLSPAHERDTTYIAVHMYQGMAWEPYFRAVEEIADSYGGRPHWGKRHFQTAASLKERYPRWDDFTALRDRLDPQGRFRNTYLDKVLGRRGLRV